MTQSVLDTNVLVLNRFYMAIRVVNVRRALTLLYRQCAEVIDMDADQYVSYDFDSWCELSQLTSIDKQLGEEYLQAVGFELQVPRIARLTRFDKMPMQTVRFNRKNLFARDEHTCQYCGHAEPTHKLSLDHVIPRSHGGPTTWENIVCCCLRCSFGCSWWLPRRDRSGSAKRARCRSVAAIFCWPLTCRAACDCAIFA